MGGYGHRPGHTDPRAQLDGWGGHLPSSLSEVGGSRLGAGLPGEVLAEPQVRPSGGGVRAEGCAGRIDTGRHESPSCLGGCCLWLPTGSSSLKWTQGAES